MYSCFLLTFFLIEKKTKNKKQIKIKQTNKYKNTNKQVIKQLVFQHSYCLPA
jgi:hypothetical protein